MVHGGMTLIGVIGNSVPYGVVYRRLSMGHGGMALIGVIENSLLYSVGNM